MQRVKYKHKYTRHYTCKHNSHDKIYCIIHRNVMNKITATYIVYYSAYLYYIIIIIIIKIKISFTFVRIMQRSETLS